MARLIGARKVPTVNDGGGVWGLNDQAKFKRDGIWPLYVRKTQLLMQFNGDNNSTDFIDSSTAARSFSVAVGSPVISTAQAKFGGSSLYLDGSSRISTAGSSDFDISSVDGTVEFWIYPSATFGGIIGQVNNDSNWQIYRYSDGRIGVGHAGVSEIVGGNAASDTWNHVAIVKSGGTTTIYINGTSVISSASVVFTNTANSLLVGGYVYGSVAYNFSGYIDDLRFVKGLAVYTGNFTQPSSELEVI